MARVARAPAVFSVGGPSSRISAPACDSNEAPTVPLTPFRAIRPGPATACASFNAIGKGIRLVRTTASECAMSIFAFHRRSSTAKATLPRTPPCTERIASSGFRCGGGRTERASASICGRSRATSARELRRRSLKPRASSPADTRETPSRAVAPRTFSAPATSSTWAPMSFASCSTIGTRKVPSSSSRLAFRLDGSNSVSKVSDAAVSLTFVMRPVRTLAM